MVKPFADSELDALKRKMRDIPSILDTVANEEIEKLDPSIHSISIKYEPRIGKNYPTGVESTQGP